MRAGGFPFLRLAVERIYPTVSHNRYDLQVEPFGGMYAVVWSAQRQILRLQSAPIRPEKTFSKKTFENIWRNGDSVIY